MSKIFISWSKEKSKKIAIETKKIIETLDPSIEVFVSEGSIDAGSDVQEKIIENISKCDKLILCFTSENKLSPWLLFEAGYARGIKKKVIPILFDDDPEWPSWIDNPMNVAREIRFNHENFTSDILNCFEIKNYSSNYSSNNEALKKYVKNIKLIQKDYKKKYSCVDSQCEDLVENLISNDAFKLDNPYFHDKTAYFLSGFESFALLEVITQSFLYSSKYLWIYGRKNMKLFIGDFGGFFNHLHEKTSDNTRDMDGIDFRCLFLDPESPEVKNAHIGQNIFKSELKNTIVRAKETIGDNALLKKSFRLYSDKRDEIIIRLDNSIIYSRPKFDAHGRPQIITNSAFEVFGCKTEKGKRCIKKFKTVWDRSKPMFDSKY